MIDWRYDIDRKTFQTRVVWKHSGKRYRSALASCCPYCMGPVVRLPKAIRAIQPDDTDHVCLGCDHGFTKDEEVKE